MSQFRKRTFHSNPHAFKFLTVCCLLLPEVRNNNEYCEIIWRKNAQTNPKLEIGYIWAAFHHSVHLDELTSYQGAPLDKLFAELLF